MKTSKNIIYYLGNILMVISVVTFFYIISPILLIYIFPPKVQSVENVQGMYLTIPKIGAQAKITENVDPFNEAEYENALKKTIAHAKGTSLPGQKGTVFIFAHSSGPPWEITRLNTIFLRLGDLGKGDVVEIQRNNKTFKYKVTEKKEVLPSEVEYLLDTKKDQLILQTCTPIGTDLKRLLVFAEPE